MTRRTGSSLMEVLVTIGILAIGLTSVITLFPFAAITMGQALKDDRTTSCAISADGYMRDYHRRAVVEVASPTEPYFTALDGGGTATGLPLDGPSYPVFIDPMGWWARSGRTDQNLVGDNGATGIPRRSLNAITTDVLALSLFSQRDGLSYDEDGNVAGGVGMREMRYNWLNVVQRPVNRDRSTLTLKVVVFDKRTHMYAPPGWEAVYQGVTFTPTRTAITGVPSTAEIRKGTWVMDATLRPGTTLMHANFYRVVSVIETGNTYTLELHTAVHRTDGRSDPVADQYVGTLLVMPGVAEVFERPTLTPSPAP